MSFTDFTPYSTAKPLFSGTAPAWLSDPLEQERVRSYDLYEKIYWNAPQTFKIKQRGDDNADPVYIPSGRVVVDTLHRFLAPALSIVPDPDFPIVPEGLLVMKAFLARERFFSKFSTNKKEGIFRGDWCWHVFANPELPEGARISIEAVDPASVFPIYNEENVDQVIGYNIVDQTTYDQKPAIRRLQYRKETGTGGPSPITVSDIIFEQDAWGGPGAPDETPLQVVTPLSTLPPPIDQLPIYWIPHTAQTGTMYGSSELRGMERIITALNQTVSDEELSLALEGLGVYVTNAGTPVDDNGEDVPWRIYPGGVVELPTGGEKIFFERKQGITSVEPYNDLQKYLTDSLYDATGSVAVARGDVDVSVAESGIALLLRLAPLLAKSAEIEQTITDVITNMLWDLRMFFAAYEASALAGPLQEMRFVPMYGDKIPLNKEKRLEEILKLFEAKVVSLPWVLGELVKLGYDIGDVDAMVASVQGEAQVSAQLGVDAIGGRLDAELQQGVSGEDEDAGN